MPKPLTDALIRSLKPPEKGQLTVTDASLENFGLRISQGGSKTFVVLLGKGRRQTLGRYPLLSLADARAEARRILAEKTLGRIQPKRAAFEDCLNQYLAECKPRLRPLSYKLYESHLRRDFPFGREAIADITPRQVIERLNRLTPSMKEHAARIGRTFFDWAVRNHYLDTSPMARIRPPERGRSRDRVLSDNELSAVLRALRRLAGPYPAIVELCVRTGQRRGELSMLEWSWIDEKAMTLTFPGSVTKNKHEHTVPITETILSLIKSQPQLSERYVFPASRERRQGQPATTFAGWSKAKDALDKELGDAVAPWTLHDLRRTVATNLQRLGVRLEVTEALLNHVSGSRGGIQGVYQRYHWLPEMAEAVLKLERFIATLLPSGD